ncbi:hypothetical protein, partial [Oceanicoccus sp.]|uniref:hypothetical protein n=1 Tax=Oceanicoccus sp. TaxID=2691044 RepID=UPI00263415E2
CSIRPGAAGHSLDDAPPATFSTDLKGRQDLGGRRNPEKSQDFNSVRCGGIEELTLICNDSDCISQWQRA